jgi:hypothetical protein
VLARVDLGYGFTQGSRHVWIGRFIEADMTITDLHEAEISSEVFYLLLQYLAESKRFQNAGLQQTKSARSSPGHALQKTATIHSVAIEILFNVFRHMLSSGWVSVLVTMHFALRSPI